MTIDFTKMTIKEINNFMDDAQKELKNRRVKTKASYITKIRELFEEIKSHDFDISITNDCNEVIIEHWENIYDVRIELD